MLEIGEDELCRVMERIAERDVPLCVQDAQTSELPSPFSAGDGVLAYYLLELEEPIGGAMLLLHTESAPRGFTLLCQSLGLRLIDAATALFETARARDALRSELARTSEQARRDSLTGLANRLAWDEATVGASIPGSPTSIVQIDCRGLKIANDTHGHDVGDRLLRRVAEIIAASVREHDLVARIGGDEFAVLLPDADEDVSADVTTRIHALLVDEPPIETVLPQVVIGAATTRDGNLAAAQKTADTRMREAKRLTPLRAA
jgi:diguanylate cyclase (GGDEF)-like protein